MFHVLAEYFPKENHLTDCLEIINNEIAPIAWELGCKDVHLFEGLDHSRIVIYGTWDSQSEFDHFMREVINRKIDNKIMTFCRSQPRRTNMMPLPTPKRKAA